MRHTGDRPTAMTTGDRQVTDRQLRLLVRQTGDRQTVKTTGETDCYDYL